MKVVLFCGGLGFRMRDYSDKIPKPMIPIGQRPILWHIMKYYANFGHKEFILCLGYGADSIKEYFLTYNECMSNDFVMLEGGRQVSLQNKDIQDWKITFVDTGIKANIGERLQLVEKYIADDPVFLANYSDGLTDMPLDLYIEFFNRQNKVGSFVTVNPPLSYHLVKTNAGGVVSGLVEMDKSGIQINGGYFIFKREIFKYMQPGEELVREPFQRLIKDEQLLGYRYDGFWASMDTFKDKQALEEMYDNRNAKWVVWEKASQKKAV